MYWNWKIGGLALGGVFFVVAAVVKPIGGVFFVVAAVVKPIGVSTQYVILDGILARSVKPTLIQQDTDAKNGHKSTNAYLDKSGGKYAKSIAHPLNYGFIFALSMIGGGMVGRFLHGGNRSSKPARLPVCHQDRFGDRPAIRYLLAFLGGVVVLWGARLAGGCSSGHMMSGIMQTSLSGYVFTFGVFATAVPTAILLYRKGGGQ